MIFFVRNCTFFDLTAVNMRKSPYSLYKSCENYLNMKFRPKSLTRSRENPKKPDFLKIAYKKNLRFFGGNRAVSRVLDFDPLTTYRISKKSLEPISL